MEVTRWCVGGDKMKAVRVVTKGRRKWWCRLWLVEVGMMWWCGGDGGVLIGWRGKENGIYILQSIDHGPFELGTTKDTLGTTPEGGFLLGPERPHTYDDLNENEKKLFDANVRATSIVLQGLPKDIYKLINHNIEAKAIWDNVKMLLAGSELTKEDSESQLYDEFERFKMLLGENINEYYVRFHKLVNDMRNIIMTMTNIQLNSKFVNNMSPEWDMFVTVVKLNKVLKETNHEQLYAYLKQHEKHAAQDRLIIERITPTTNDQIAFVSSVQPYTQSSPVQSHQYSPSSAPLLSPHHPKPSNRSGWSGRGSKCLGVTESDSEELCSGKWCSWQWGEHIRARNVNAYQGKLFKCFNCNGLGHIVRNCTQPKRQQNSDYFKDKMLLIQAQENGAVLDEEDLLFLTGEQTNNFDADVDDHPVRDLALNDDNIFQADECDAFESDVDDEPTAQSIFMANLSSAGLTNQQVGPSNALILSEVHYLENTIDPCDDNQDEHEIHNEVQQKDIIDSTRDHMVTEFNIYKEQVAIYEQRARCPEPFYLKQTQKAQPALYNGNELLKTHHVPVLVLSSEEDLELAVNAMKTVFENLEAEVDQNAIDLKSDSAMTASRFHELSIAYTVAMNRVVELEAENSKLLEKIKNDDHDSMVKDFLKLEVAHLNLQLKHQHLKENIENFKSKSSKDAPEFDAFFELTLQERLQNFKAENEKVKLHYQELFNSIKITRYQSIDKTMSLQNEIENLKTQLKGNLPCVTSNDATPKVPACAKYEIDVQLIPLSQRNNRVVHHGVSKATKARRSQPKSNTTHDRTLSANSVPKKKVKDRHRKNKSKLSKKNRVGHSDRPLVFGLRLLKTYDWRSLTAQEFRKKVYMGQVFEIKGRNSEFVVKLLKQLQVGLNKTVRHIQTDNGTKFVNKDLTAYYESVGITLEKTVPRTPQQNGVVEQRNRTLIEAARTISCNRRDSCKFMLVINERKCLCSLPLNKGFAAVLAVLKPERLKADRAQIVTSLILRRISQVTYQELV
nr:putative zinc finger, CCHC-type [Tanacetum cinerariifolium]